MTLTVISFLKFFCIGELNLPTATKLYELSYNPTVDGNTCGLALKFGDGTVSSVTEMNILAEVQYTGDHTQYMGEGGIFWNIPFECVVNSSTEALKISLFSDTAIGSM